MKPVRLVIIGAGDRGNVYASYARHHPERAKVVGVAEPIDARRDAMMTQYALPESNAFRDWRDLAKLDRFADVAVVATQDAMHEGPAVALANKGYHLLLEKPMAPNKEGCKNIVGAVLRNDVMFSVGHVLRYTRFTRRLKSIIDSGAIGEVVGIQRLEPVGYWHQAHSFVRGNWRNEKESSFMLLAKSCHDIDWIRYVMGRRCTSVSSFGNLFHFREDNKPANAGSRCTECDYEPDCPYSALKIYLGFVDKGVTGWPVHVLLDGEPTRERVMSALQSGPYGRCVYACDNDVVDHQVVNMEFEGGGTASFTMMAFTKARQRETRIFGTRGEAYGNGTRIEVHDFQTDTTSTIDTSADDPSSLSDHGGGDYALMDSFVEAVATGERSHILSGPQETLESHLITFAAEESRQKKRVVVLQ